MAVILRHPLGYELSSEGGLALALTDATHACVSFKQPFQIINSFVHF